MEYVDGCKLLGNNEILESDHRSYAVDIALQDYFNDELSEWDNIGKTMLNLV